MKVVVYNQQGEETGNAVLPKEIFDVPLNPDLVHQVVVSQAANRRQRVAHTKTRGEVRGGGKKPWRQKGTGRARHGSIRSPLWRHGGVTFGPRNEKVFKKNIPEKMRKKAVLMALSAKSEKGLLVLLDNLGAPEAKTKIMAEIFKKLPVKSASALILLPEYDKNIILAAKNLPRTRIVEARNLSALDILSFKYLIAPKDAIRVIKEIFVESEKRKAPPASLREALRAGKSEKI